MPSTQLGFIGAGNMAEAIARGMLAAKLLGSEDMLACDPSAERRELFGNQLKIKCVDDPAAVAAASDMLILAVKPQSMETALQQIAPALPEKTLVISIAAGITTGYIEATLGNRPRVVRVMPNTPMLAGAGMSALARGAHACDEDLGRTEWIFSAAGKTARVRENLIDAVTALSGSGPAYFYFLVEAISAAGVKLGLSGEQAELLARQTAIGTGRLLEASQEPPAELRRKVTSPGGTTQAAIESLQRSHFAEIIETALTAAADRSKELAK